MALFKLLFKPGIDRNITNYSGEGGWYDGDLIRFDSGYPRKLKGWTKATANTFIGYCRQMWNWVTSYSDNLLALGTNEKVYIEPSTGDFYNITPLRTTSPATMTTTATDNSVYTTNTSTTVIMNFGSAHGATSNNWVTVTGATAVGGVPAAEINDDHRITVVNSTALSFVVSTAATSTVSGGGGTSINVAFELEIGNGIATEGYGWGAGSWSRGSWGLGAATDPVTLGQRDWWFDNFDNDLIMNVRGGEGYIWERGTSSDVTSPLATRAIRLITYAGNEGYTSTAVPIKITQLLVSQRDKHLIAFGAVPYGSSSAADFDPNLIRWASQDAPGQWTPAVTNSAGDLRVSRGSGIVRALPTRQEILVWTDSSLHSLQFLGTTDVFGLQEYAYNISIASPRAVCLANDVVYWMGRDKFYIYTGRTDTLPCSVSDYIFDDLNVEQSVQIISGTLEEWNEIWWFYPSSESNYNDRYVVYNYAEQLWYYGNMPRTAWLEVQTRQYPHACNTTGGATEGYMYEHENGLDADGVAMESYITSADFDIGDGDQYMLCKRIIPDVNFNQSSAATPSGTLEIKARNFPGDTQFSFGDDDATVSQSAVDTYTKQVFIRARARQMALKFSSSNTGVDWRFGSPRLDARLSGKR